MFSTGLHLRFLDWALTVWKWFFGDALAMSTFLASVNSSSFPSYNFLFSEKLLIFPDSIWKSDLGQPAWPVFSGLKKSAPFGFLKGGILESGMDEIFSRMRQISLVLLWIARWRGGCAGFFYLIKAAIFPETDIVSLVPLPGCGRVDMKLRWHRKSGKEIPP